MLLAVSATLVLGACSKSPEKVLPRKDGKWSVSATNTTKATNETKNYTSILDFDKDGTVTEDNNGTVTKLNWEATSSTVTMKYGTVSFTYEVTEKKLNSEKWKYENATMISEATLKRIK